MIHLGIALACNLPVASREIDSMACTLAHTAESWEKFVTPRLALCATLDFQSFGTRTGSFLELPALELGSSNVYRMAVGRISSLETSFCLELPLFSSTTRSQKLHEIPPIHLDGVSKMSVHPSQTHEVSVACVVGRNANEIFVVWMRRTTHRD